MTPLTGMTALEAAEEFRAFAREMKRKGFAWDGPALSSEDALHLAFLLDEGMSEQVIRETNAQLEAANQRLEQAREALEVAAQRFKTLAMAFDDSEWQTRENQRASFNISRMGHDGVNEALRALSAEPEAGK